MRLLIGTIEDEDKALAVAHARSLAEGLFDAPQAAWLHLQREGEGWLYEIHEGGDGRSLAAEILLALKGGPVILRRGGKGVEIFRDGHTGKIDTIFLPDADEREATILAEVGRRPKMRRLYPQGRGAVIAGAMVAVAGLAAMAAVVATEIARPTVEQVAVTATPAAMTPLAQEKLLQPPDGQYIARLYYEAGRWQVETRPLAAEDGVDAGQ